MNRGKKRKFGLFLACILFLCAASAQNTEYYKVTGGMGTPLLAADNSRDRIQVYFVYGMENVRISYTSSSASHQWCRYKTRPDLNDPERVSSVQDGTTSTITDVEDGYGYYVDEGSMRRYVWIIDYSKYEPDIRSFRVIPDFDECEGLRFEGDADIKDITYYTPSGVLTKINRVFELSYQTLEWKEELRSFLPLDVSKTFDTDPFATTFRPSGLPGSERYFPLVLTDTEITLSGDLFARHFGVETSASIPYYEAQAIEVYADTTAVYTGPGGNVQAEEEGELLAPTEVTFSARANVPVASLFTWKVLRLGENDTTEIVRFNGEDLVHMFNLEGEYLVRLEVAGSRSKKCEYTAEFRILITETIMEIPNAFSPGCTPGINDIFRVRSKSVVKFQGWIFNRWGTEMFRWTDPSQGWDGKYRGKYVPAGAYYYLIEYTGTNGRKRVRKGDVNVYRTKDVKMELDPVE
ncbi:MAG: gliding motility-associated C-terminal domain-containing protein [Tannerella sp.]|jgi:gliding motility-associated-like protein|nr:gliding motility-associated C-terminal domain-containing protein [Tannerella sp.]